MADVTAYKSRKKPYLLLGELGIGKSAADEQEGRLNS